MGSRMAKELAHPAPRGVFDKPGKAAWERLVGSLPDGWSFDPRELEILTEACKVRDLIGELETAIGDHGAMVSGSKGQKVVNPAYAELRQQRALYAQLLGKLELVDAPATGSGTGSDGKPQSAASKQASKAARSRWGSQSPRAAGQSRMNV